ncbi:Type I restriction-modification system methyltransferase subunit [Hoeflea phototrophica DFL-43]|uniref:site-specific DNA-methyltransferase (adenine-specific) n=1 Tax=Hoeflea phototrophica (strain DSM 17068 / NCIMB 14078 / DFL-43) TaxID=411684 RepID=A9D2X0_HOEPD|nr:N-6 DNA methylase [Hoeflea phototrophica]EDQ34289.1 Type I restriction-modification system methyltransferase subunit [Hoeflea phototrophica DFL-43]
MEIFERIAKRNDKRTESEIQADVRQFILSAPLNLHEDDVTNVLLESQTGDRRRIDVEVGSTVIEVKRDLRKGKVKPDAVEQLAGYVELRMNQTGLRYVGVLTDGTEWLCYDLVEGKLREVSTITVEPTAVDMEKFTVWLEGVLATAQNIAPTARNIELRLGAGSSSYQLDRATMASLYEQFKDSPTVQMKRTLWSRLLTSALGTAFEDTDDLFIEHTLLVNTAEIIAHAVLGLPVQSLNPAALLAGEKFDESGIHGVVEADFFDWIVEIDGGDVFVRTLAKRLARFEWSKVEQDVLKVLYESVIGTETRQRLGEYYTPDWLADIVVQETVTEPLNSRVLDAACGSGTFLFHAIRRYIVAAEAKGMTVGQLIDGVTEHVIGMDLHPVAVTLARVTYLLAIGRHRLIDPDRGTIHIPVYLGDSLQWQEQNTDLWTAGNLVIQTDDKKDLFGNKLSFPDALVDDAARFDELVNEMAKKAATRKPKSAVPSMNAVFQRLAIPDRFKPTIEATFETMCQLHDEGRDHIWGYYIRNLARPLWLSRPKNRVDVLVGNPPWLAYRKMTSDMQTSFRNMSEDRGLWAGGELSTHQDLSGLFAVRACELYLKVNGRFGLVLPNAAIDREHYTGFRSGYYGDGSGNAAIAFEPSWDLRRIRPHFFPRAASVVFGMREEHTRETRQGEGTWAGREMPVKAEIWSGGLSEPNMPWMEASKTLSRESGQVKYVGQLTKSPYHQAFAQGATFTPRMVFVVEEQPASSLGLPTGRKAIISSRSVQEKKPWKDVPSITGVVETEFLRPFFTGDNAYPFRLGDAQMAVLPCQKSGMLNKSQFDLHPGLSQWWERAEAIWLEKRSSDRLTLTQRLDYQSSLSKQFPIPQLRLVYNRAGMHLMAAKVKNKRAVIANGLYWASMETEAEADYLCAVMNAPVTTELVRPFMSYGKDERDIHKHVWEVPIPKYDPAIALHNRLSELGKRAEEIAAVFPIDPNLHFAATRRHIRAHLEATSEGQEIDELVFELLG